MVNKEQIKCKYKFQDKEKFDGKPYCLCFCEVCEDLPPCDDNCQIYEDFKQLVYKTQIINEIEEAIKPYQEPIELDALSLPGAIESILERKTKECDTLKSQLDFAVQQRECLEHECEELKAYAQRQENQREEYYKEFVKKDKALEEIEAATKINCEEICGRKFEDCNDTSCFSAELLDIINKAKGI